MVSDSNISDISIENTSTTVGIALKVLSGVSNVSVERAQITSKGTGRHYGVYLFGGNIFSITNSSVYATGTSGDVYGIWVDDHGVGSSTVLIRDVISNAEIAPTGSGSIVGIGIFGDNNISISDTMATAIGGSWAEAIENWCRNGSVAVSNVKAEAQNGGQVNTAFYQARYTGNCSVKINNSELTAGNSTASDNSVIDLRDIDSPIEVNNSQLKGSSYSILSADGSANLKVGGSLVMGTLSLCPTCKLVNCYDENFNPIPNQ